MIGYLKMGSVKIQILQIMMHKCIYSLVDLFALR